MCARRRAVRSAAHRRWLRQLPAACVGAADNGAADASVEGLLQRPLQHPAQGTGLVRLQGPTVVSVAAGARTRRSTRPSARVHRSAPVYAWGLFVPAVEAASVRARRASQGRAVWPARSSAARRCGQARAHPRARPQLVGVRAGLTAHPLHSP